MTRRTLLGLLLGSATTLAMPTSSLAAPRLKEIAPTYYATDAGVAFVRTADGTLHLVYPVRSAGANNGVVTRTVSSSGVVSQPVPVAVNFPASRPGVVALPNGALWAAFGGQPSLQAAAGVWGAASTNGGATWSAPVFIGSGSTFEAGSYAADVTAALVGPTPWLTMNVAGGLSVQAGFGPAAPTAKVDTPPTYDGFLGAVDTVVDAAAGELVASWDSAATPGGDFIQGIGPSVQAAHLVPGQRRNAVVLASRDAGPGVFAAYTPDNDRVRLFRYGGGSVAVGKVKGLTAKVLGVATGRDGRIWVIWGDDSAREVAVTRSNKAVTRFEPIQVIKDNAFDIWRFSGDGRLGPLDLLIDETPVKPVVEATYYVRVLPTLSVSAKAHRLNRSTLKLTVKVTDAGDPVAGARVRVDGKHTKTKKSGAATLKVRGTNVALTVNAAGYRQTRKKVKL